MDIFIKKMVLEMISKEGACINVREEKKELQTIWIHVYAYS